MHILVTGHTGFKGGWLTQVLLNCGAKVSGIALKPDTIPNLFTALQLKNKVNNYFVDIRNFKKIKEVIKKEKPDYIIHAAAYTQVDKAEENIELCREINSYGTKNIAAVAKEYDIKLIYISTDFVFDGKKNKPYTEDDKPNPTSVYGLTKYEGEKYVQKFCEKYYIIRVSWLFGHLLLLKLFFLLPTLTLFQQNLFLYIQLVIHQKATIL